jgi:hypothetical protein
MLLLLLSLLLNPVLTIIIVLPPPPIQSADWHAGQEEGKDEIQPPQAPPPQALPPRVMQDNNDKPLTLPPLPTTITKSTMQ